MTAHNNNLNEANGNCDFDCIPQSIRKQQIATKSTNANPVGATIPSTFVSNIESIYAHARDLLMKEYAYLNHAYEKQASLTDDIPFETTRNRISRKDTINRTTDSSFKSRLKTLSAEYATYQHKAKTNFVSNE